MRRAFHVDWRRRSIYGVGVLEQRPSNKLVGGIAELIDCGVHFKQCLNLGQFVDDYTFKCLNCLIGVLGI